MAKKTVDIFDEIIGYNDIKKQLMEIVDIMNNREVYAKFGVKVPRGVLFTGAPGLGKTLMANCLMEAAPGWNKYVLRKTKSNGDFVKEIKDTFDEAVKNAPAIILLDDMDKFANGDNKHPDCDEYVTIQSCIDFVKNKDVIVIATVNKPFKLPDALIRSGRFDRHIHMYYPSDEDARLIIASYLKKCKNVAQDIDTELIARLLIGQSCAVLETIINESGLCAGYERADKLQMRHILDATLKIVYDIPNRNVESDEDTERRAYHEAGHVIVNEHFSPGSVTLATVIRSGRTGGVTTHNRSHNNTYESVEETACVCLGSRAAMEYKFGIADIGCSGDLSKSFDIIRENISENGVRGFGLLTDERCGDSQVRVTKIETACNVELERLYLETKKIIHDNVDFLEKVAQALIEKKVITCNDIAEIRKELAA